MDCSWDSNFYEHTTMKMYKQFVFEIVRRVEDMKNLNSDDIIKGMDIIDKTSVNKFDKKNRRRKFMKDLTGLDLP